MEDIFAEFSSKFSKAKKLYEKSQHAPPSKSQEWKREALEAFRELDDSITKVMEEDTTRELELVSALSNYELGVVMYDADDLPKCEQYLQKSWELIQKDSLRPEVIILAINVLNQLGILWSAKSELQRARECLKQAEKLYETYKSQNNSSPKHVFDLFANEATNKDEKSWLSLDKALTNSMYYLSQVHEHLSDRENSTKYCYLTLRRQLDHNDYESLEWSLNCATLSQYFVSNGRFKAARYILSCAHYMVNDFEIKLKAEMENVDDKKLDQLSRSKADIARCWAKYAIQLLMLSYEKKLGPTEDNHSNSAENSSDGSDDYMATFKLLDEQYTMEYESKVSFNKVCSFEDAKLIFLFGIECINNSKKYYNLSDHTAYNVLLQQDNCNLYKFLAIFEVSLERKCKMHRRRINILEDILKQLNTELHLSLCRQLTFELAEIYNEMVCIKLRIANMKASAEGVEVEEGVVEEDSLSESAIKKINFLTWRSIEHYTAFIDCLRDADKRLPDPLPDHLVRTALIAFFSIGRMYSQIIDREAVQEVKYMKKTQVHYKFVVKYIERYPQYEALVAEELSIIKNMLEILPSKIGLMESTIAFLGGNM